MLQDAVYDAVVSVKGVKGWESISDAFKAAKGETTNDRKTRVLAAVDELPDATRDAVTNAAQAAIDSRAGLAGIKNPMSDS